MMRISFNEGYNKCFGCGQANPIGPVSYTHLTLPTKA